MLVNNPLQISLDIPINLVIDDLVNEKYSAVIIGLFGTSTEGITHKKAVLMLLAKNPVKFFRS
jgi:hypothetical protein